MHGTTDFAAAGIQLHWGRTWRWKEVFPDAKQQGGCGYLSLTQRTNCGCRTLCVILKNCS